MTDEPDIVRFGLFERSTSRLENCARAERGSSCRSSHFKLLAVLLERPGEIVTKEEFKERLWASDTFVDLLFTLVLTSAKI